MEKEIWNFIGMLVAYSGGGIAISYGVFVFLGKKIIDKKFAESNLDFKYQKDKDLANYEKKINTLLNRVTKIHEKEFQVLPEAWNKLQDCFIKLSYFTRMFRQEPDFSSMNPEQLEAFFDDLGLNDYQKKQLKIKTDKPAYYQDVIFWHEFNDVRKSFSEFVQYIKKNRIFLSNDLKEKFQALEEIMWSAIIDQEVGHQSHDSKMKIDAYKTVRKEIDPIIHEIEDLVQKRLKYNEAE